MIVIRAGISAGVDIPPNYADTVEEAEQRLADAVRDVLARVGNVRTAVEVKLALTDVPQMRDVDVSGYLDQDYDGRYEWIRADAQVTHRLNPSWTGRVLRVEHYPGQPRKMATVIWSWAMSARRADPRDLVVIG